MDTPSENKKNTLLYTLIALLVLLLLVQTGLLIHLATKKDTVKALPERKKIQRSAEAFSPARTYARRAYDPGALGHRARSSVYPPSFWDDPFFQDAFTSLGRLTESMQNLFEETAASGGFAFAPTVDLQETEAAYVLRSDIPGLEKDKIDITVQGDLLTLQGIRESRTESKSDAKDGAFYSQERQVGSFARTVPLPGPVDEGKITADYTNGVLTVTLPKSKQESAQANKIKIQ